MGVTPPASVLHRIEALAGRGRYAVTFRRRDGAEQTAVVQLDGARLTAAEAGLPGGWERGGPAFGALTDAVRAVEAARDAGPAAAELADVDGGWDVMMGNVVLAADTPTCTAHGALTPVAGGVWECPECGARAAYAA